MLLAEEEAAEEVEVGVSKRKTGSHAWRISALFGHVWFQANDGSKVCAYLLSDVRGAVLGLGGSA